MSKERAAPPQLMFDDGSRIMTSSAAEQSPTLPSPRGSVPIEDYYEVERLSQEVLGIVKDKSPSDDGFLCRVALQFPDEILQDGPDVCWAMEEKLTELSRDTGLSPLVFILGDTTFGPCCPDEISALHLQADVLVHYGHACLSPALSLPVLYGFGITDMNVSACVEVVLDKAKEERVENLLVLYEVRYHHAMETLQKQLTQTGNFQVVTGQIPSPCNLNEPKNSAIPSDSRTACCSSAQRGTPNACQSDSDQNVDQGDCCKSKLPNDNAGTSEDTDEPETFVVGGLQVPHNVDLSCFTLLFVGDLSLEGSSSSSRQYVNTMLRLMSSPQCPANYWTYSPCLGQLETSLPSTLKRQLNRRFYLVQKARDASVFGILVGTLSQRHFRTVVSSLRTAIETSGRACYTFAVGKVNGAKLANFGEIECFVLVACGENSLLDNERDLHVPVITPLELNMALGNVEWGSTAYSLDYNDFLAMRNYISPHNNASDDEEQDAPYFSLVTGKYEPSKKVSEANVAKDNVDLAALPGKGQLMAYNSAASDYLKNREYTGLEANVGHTQVQAAVQGQTGIASDYGQR